MGASDLSSLDGVRRSMYLVMEAMEGTLKDMVVRQMTSRCVCMGGRKEVWMEYSLDHRGRSMGNLSGCAYVGRVVRMNGS